MRAVLGRILFAVGLVVASTATVSTASAAATWYCSVSEVNQNGYSYDIWLRAGNGFIYCMDRGFRTMVDYTSKCGEDELSYLDYDSSSGTWVNKASGSKNGCYPLFSCIRCQ